MAWANLGTGIHSYGFEAPQGYPYVRPYKGRRSGGSSGRRPTYRAGSRASHTTKAMRRRRGF